MRPAHDEHPVVLVVDDEAILRLHAACLLETEGFEVLETRDDVRLLFTDIQMPGEQDGMDLAREVHERWPHVLLLVTSGRLRPTDEELPDHGRFLAKPYQPDVLIGEVRDLVDQPSSVPA